MITVIFGWMNNHTLARKIAIIGCGYVGSALARHWVASGRDVVATTTRPERLPVVGATGATPRLLTAEQHDVMHDLLRDRDAVLLSVAAGRRHGDYRGVYLQAAQSLADAIADTPVRRIIYTSSSSVYHQDDGSWVDEDSPTSPQKENGKILVETERTLLGISEADTSRLVSVVRLTGIYGPDRALADFVSRSAGTERDDGDAYLNLVHRDDIVRAVAKLVEIGHGGILNLSDDMPTTRRDFYDRMLAELGLAPIRWRESDNASLGKRVSNRRIKSLLELNLAHRSH